MNAINLLLVGVGGFAGSAARYLTVVSLEKKLNAVFPYGTLTVNIAGSFLLGIVLAWISGKSGQSGESWRLLIGTGFCGGFTTFSAFAAENVSLFDQRLASTALLYILISVVGGLLAVWAGFAAFRTIF